MIFVSTMWAIWGAVVLLFAAVKLYALILNRDKGDQLVLDGSPEHARVQQAATAARLTTVRRVERTLLWVVCVMTIIVLGCYIVNMVSHFK